MRSLHLGLALPLVGAVILLADRPATHPANPLQAHVRAEVIRLQAHFDSVDQELRGRDVSTLTTEQRTSRTRLVAWLRDYRDSATFPLNDGVSPHAVPIFRDSRGELCAMAYLVHRSGRQDIVDDVAASRNTASVFDLADDPRLSAWLDSTGLTLNEAARIQPWYGEPPPPPGSDRNRVSADYALTSIAFSGSAIAFTGVNIASPSRLSGVLGFVAGTVAMLHGVMRLDESGGTRRVAAVNTGIGALSMSMAFRGISRSPKPVPPPVPVAGQLSNVELAPMVALLGRPQLGFALRARF